MSGFALKKAEAPVKALNLKRSTAEEENESREEVVGLSRLTRSEHSPFMRGTAHWLMALV